MTDPLPSAELVRLADAYADVVICYRTTTPSAHRNTVREAFLAGAAAAAPTPREHGYAGWRDGAAYCLCGRELDRHVDPPSTPPGQQGEL